MNEPASKPWLRPRASHGGGGGNGESFALGRHQGQARTYLGGLWVSALVALRLAADAAGVAATGQFTT